MRTRRPPLSLFALLVLLLVAVVVYGYFTTPLPFGLSRLIPTPGGASQSPQQAAGPGAGTGPSSGPTTGTGTGTGTGTPTAPAAGGSALTLGQLVVTVQQVQHSVSLSTGTGTGTATGTGTGTALPIGPPSLYTVLGVSLTNSGRLSVPLQADSFQLEDAQGRLYTVDEVASTVACAQQGRAPQSASVPPGGTLSTCLAFQVAPGATGLTLLATLGAGTLPLPS